MKEDKRLNEVIRVKKRPNGFVMMDKEFLENATMSWKAKGILAYLLSKPDNWKVIVGDVIKHATDGKTSVYNGLAELSQHGYYEKVPIRNKSGQRIDYWESTVYELPKATNPIDTASALLPGFQDIDNQDIGFQDIENRERNKNYLNNNDFNNNQSSQVLSASSDRLYNDMTEGKSMNYAKWIKKKISYDNLLAAHPYDAGMVDEFVAIIVDVIMTRGEYVRISGEDKPRELVKSVLMKLSYHDIEHVITQFKNVTEPITKKKQYILTMLYNCKLELDSHYTNAVISDRWQ